MKSKLITLAIISAFSFSAQAAVFGDSSTTNNNQVYNQPQSHATANGGQGGNATGGNAAGGSATVGDIRNTNTNTALGGTGGSVAGSGNSTVRNDNTNAQQQGQGQKQGQQQGQQQGQSTENANNSKQQVTVGGDTYEAQKRAPVNTAYASSVAPTAPCMGSTSGGLSTVGVSFSLGGTWTDENCVLLEQVRATSNIGDRETALEMMMDIPAYAAAKKRLADRKNGTAVTAAPVSASVVVASNADDEIVFAAARANGYTGNDFVVAKRIAKIPATK